MADYERFPVGRLALQCGLTLPDAVLAYKTYGALNAARDNTILVPTFYAGDHTDIEPILGPDRALDPGRYFIVVPNLFGNGVSSSPSNTRRPFERAAFPKISLYDNVTAQYRLITEHLGIERLRLVTGFSMGAQQAYQWGALYSDQIGAIAPICGSARTSPHNYLFLDGVKAALQADQTFAGGWYETAPVVGLRAFSRVYAGWMFSQGFFRDEAYRELGLQSLEDLVRFVEAYFRRRDANDLLSLLATWQAADISANERFRGDLRAALKAIHCPAIVMPGETDLYFPVRDNELEVEAMPNAELRPIPSIRGHMGGYGTHPEDAAFIDAALRELLEA